jgi:phosphate-selective porin OprO/OprP
MIRLSRVLLALVCICACASVSLRAQARTPAPVKDSAQVVYDDDGLRIHSADGRKQLKVRGYFAADYRSVLNDTSDAITNSLAMRRARVIFDANLNSRLAMRVMYDVGPPSSTSPVQDAYADIGLAGSWWIRAGKQKTPVGLERYMSISNQIVPERSIAQNLHASRDMGILLTGNVGEHLELAAGVFNGVPDGGGTQDTDPNDDKDLTYRVWWKPVRTKVDGVEQGFGLAFNGSTGMEKSSAAAGARLPSFKSPAASTFFSYAEASGVRAAGRHTRNGVFSYFHDGSFGTFAEWFSNSQVVSRGTTVATVGTGGWVANVAYTLTGERSAQEGITPRAGFDPEKGNWGAWQIGARAANVSVDADAFPTFADSTVAAHKALEIGVGLNWYVTKVTKMQVAYENTTYEGGAKVGDRKTERYIQIRWQAYF